MEFESTETQETQGPDINTQHEGVDLHADSGLTDNEQSDDQFVRETERQIAKSLDVKNIADAKTKIPDIMVIGDGDAWKVVCKATSKSQGWMKSTKAMPAGDGVLVQVTTQQRNIDGTYSIAEAVTYVPSCYLSENADGSVELVAAPLIKTPINVNIQQPAVTAPAPRATAAVRSRTAGKKATRKTAAAAATGKKKKKRRAVAAATTKKKGYSKFGVKLGRPAKKFAATKAAAKRKKKRG